jgi:subtilase-type serine protease
VIFRTHNPRSSAFIAGRLKAWTLGLWSFGLAALCTVPAGAQDLSAWETPEYYRSGVLAQINAAQAYAHGFTGAGVLVGVADSGLDTRHPEFAGRVLPGYDFWNDRPIVPGTNADLNGHGTHVTGIVAAARDGIGMHGVAFDATVMPATLWSPGPRNDDLILSTALNFLAEQGARIINNSYGAKCLISTRCNVTDYTRSDVDTLLPVTIERQKAAVAAGTLVVFAAGNDRQLHPDLLAAMPVLVPELEKGWLVVVAVDANNQIASFSNRCGIARNFCLAAPGETIYSTGPNGTYFADTGTSMAAPVVSGVAALVKEAFPWFTAYDLQQTLLTTATHLGDAGVNEVYGWGLVNAGKAVLGYGEFTGTTVLDTKGFSSTFANDISGAGALVKTGAGELVLTGANTYSGGSYVAGGTLSINGSVASTVFVGTDGTLRGTGIIGAPLSVAGRLAPGNSPGTLTVAGPVTLSNSATFQIDIDGTGTGSGAGSYSRLITTGIDGTVAVAGTLAPTLRGISGSAGNAFSPVLGTSFSIIQASGGLSGSFSGLAQPSDGLAPATRFDALYDRYGLSLVVTPAAYGNLAANGLQASANANAVGGALDSVRPAAGPALSGSMGPLYAGLYGTTPAALPSTLSLLAGEIHASLRTALIEDSRFVRQAANDRLRSAFDTVGASRAPVSSYDNGTPRQVSAHTGHFAVWGQAFGAWGPTGGDGNAARLNRSTGGFLIGADGAVLDTWRIGLIAGYSRTSFNLRDHASAGGSDNIHVGLYGGTRLGDFAIRTGAAYSWHDIATGRSVSLPGFSDLLKSSSRAGTAQVFGEVGYGIRAGKMGFEPFANLAYVGLATDRLHETGSAAALSAARATTNATFTTLGLRASGAFELGGIGAEARGMLGWRHAFGDVTPLASLAFAAGSAFTIAGVPIARDAVVVEAGLDFAFSPSAVLGVSYGGQFGAGLSDQTVKANFNFKF